ncbi:MAG: hypothetical protein RL077_1207, partial [Verrucomicrobiota bacterium]
VCRGWGSIYCRRGRRGGLVVFAGVELFQEEPPGGRLGGVEFAGAAGLFPENVVDVFEGLFENGGERGRWLQCSLACDRAGGKPGRGEFSFLA